MSTYALSQKGKEILTVVQLKAEASYKSIRKASGHRDHAITYHLSQVVVRGVAHRRCFLDLNVLGLHYYEIFVSLAAGPKGARAAFVERLKASPHISWVGRLGGDYHYAFTIFAHSSTELTSLLFDIFSTTSGTFFEKAVALRVAMHYFGNKYLSSKRRLREVLSYGAKKERAVVDDLDRRILSYLAESGETSIPAVSRTLNVPASTVAYRIRNLEKVGAIVGYYYEINAARLGEQSLLLLVNTKGFSASFTESLYKYCRAAPRVTMLAHSLGAWDFEIGIDIDEPHQITSVLDEIYDTFGKDINWVKVLPMFEHIKVREYSL